MVGIGVQVPILTWGDRIHQVHIADQEVAKAELELQDSQAVSYTHLDVYKRQVLLRLKGAERIVASADADGDKVLRRYVSRGDLYETA